MEEQDLLVFADEKETAAVREFDEVWNILIVDDEEEVHSVTKLVLDCIRFEGRRLAFHSVHSARQARAFLAERKDIAMMLLDVVMEDDESGLQLVRYIRNELGNKMIRIILRTGQPGKAPESSVIVDYDINDYREKTDLTAQKLQTATIGALRSYRDLQTIEQNKKGLEQIVQASPEIFRLQSMQNFANGVLTQLTSMLYLGKSSLYIKTAGFAATSQKGDPFIILAATGNFEKMISKTLDSDVPDYVVNRIKEAALRQESEFAEEYIVLYWRSHDLSAYVIYLECQKNVNEMDKRLLEVFCLNVSAAFENLTLHTEMDETQRDILMRLMEVAETRSRETGNHVRRVGEYARLLALKLGVKEEDADLYRFAAPMHDIGKIGIPDAVLTKPGRLVADEFELMKAHAAIGYEMLKGSELALFKLASVIALEHHEKYDGSGYPKGLAAERISLAARITAVADVFDALGCDRIYKKAWSIEEIRQYFDEQRGLHFDPRIVECLLENMAEFLEIKARFKD